MLKLYCRKKIFDFIIPLPFCYEESPFIGDWTEDIHLKDDHGNKFGPVEKSNFMVLVMNYGISVHINSLMKILKNKEADFLDLLKESPDVLMFDQESSVVEHYAKEHNIPWSWMYDSKQGKTVYFAVQPYSRNLYLSGLQVREPNNPFF